MKTDDVTILNFLNLPPRILLWPVSHVLMVTMPAFLFMTFGYTFLGFMVSCVVILCIKFFKRKFGEGRLQGVLYWYLPTSVEQFPVTPSSYMRTFID